MYISLLPLFENLVIKTVLLHAMIKYEVEEVTEIINKTAYLW